MNLTRNDKVLFYINKKGQGLEIGPGHSPVAPKSDGYKVHIIDHLDKKSLIEKFKNIDKDKYPNIEINLRNIEDVDFVWNGESYLELTGNSKFYDWIIASHLIEHTPDLIGFLCDCDKIMKDDAVLSLVVPDMRYCFDRFRPISGISKIIDSHINKNNRHSLGTAIEYYLNVVSKTEKIGWNKYHRGEYSLMYSSEETINLFKDFKKNNEYVDFHSWCFTPSSFRLLIHDLNSLGFIPFKEVGCFFTDGFEFFITLGRNGKGLDIGRLDMLKMIQREMSLEFSPKGIDIMKEKVIYLQRSIRRIVKKIIRYKIPK